MALVKAGAFNDAYLPHFRLSDGDDFSQIWIRQGQYHGYFIDYPDVDELFGAYLCVDEFIGRRGNFEYVFKKFGTAGIKRALYRGCGHFGYGV